MTSSSMFPSSKWRSVAGRRRGSGRFSISREQGADFDVEAMFDQEFINVNYISKKYEILFFYPLDSTCVFPTKITSFSYRHE